MSGLLKQCYICGYRAYRGFTRRWLDRDHPVWVCVRVRDCEGRIAIAAAGEGR